MSHPDQGIRSDRYTVIPRTAIFVRRADEYLLIRGSSSKGWWADKYNCLGGHVERGEDILTAAHRELLEEAGLQADLWLCGTIQVDVVEVGISLFVFLGENPQGAIKQSGEGLVEWVEYGRIAMLPVVEDVPTLLGRMRGMKRGDAPFSARSFYDELGHLSVIFADQ
jgi:8-oxo-dGTP diphosphatase